jgi:DNA-binding NarL/FixJ family response regulator
MADQVFLVEDHPISRRGQKAILDAEMNLEVCGETSGAAEALEQIPEMEPDLVLMDLSLEEGSGLDLIKNLQNHEPALLILVVSMHDESLYALRCIRAGARGYVTKQQASKVLVEAVREVLEGRIYLSDEMKDRLVQTLNGGQNAADPALESLSDRELQVFERIGHGLETSEIAQQLHLSPKPVYSYQSRIRDKLDIDTTPKLRQRAVIWVACRGFDVADGVPS